MRNRRGSFRRTLEARQAAARQERAQEAQPGSQDDSEREEDYERPRSRFLLPNRKRRPYWK